LFSHLTPTGAFAIRLPDAEREEFLRRYKTTLFEAYGVVKKDWAVVPDTLLRDTKALGRYFLASYEHVKTLKPKPSKKKG